MSAGEACYSNSCRICDVTDMTTRKVGFSKNKNCKMTHFWARSQNFEKRLLASSCLSVRLIARIEKLGSNWTYFHEILYLRIFR
jgi:hypothetical protein